MSPRETRLTLGALFQTLQDLAARERGHMALVRLRVPEGMDPDPVLAWLGTRLGGVEFAVADAPGRLGVASVEFDL